MTDSNLDIKGTTENCGTDNGARDSITPTRRSALGLSLAGGLAAMLAACGKYVTKFDKRGLLDAQTSDDATSLPGSGDGTVADGGGTDGGASGGGGPENPVVVPPPSAPAPKFCFDTSKATKVADADFFVADAKALYGSKFSSLLAVKAQKGKASSPAVGDLVHILLKKSATESYLAASRRVRSTDEYADGIGLVFESLHLDTYTGIQLVVIKGDKQYLAELPISYVSSLNGKPVYDLSLVRTDLTKSNELFGLGFGDSGAPHMGGTSNIGNSHSITSMKLLYGGSYVAAQSDSTWDLSSLIPSGTELKNIFGQSMADADKTKLLHENQSLVVYRSKAGTVGGKSIDGYLRYFIYVG